MPRDPNPYLGFRGDPAAYNRNSDGSVNWDNYGIYAPAVAATLNKCVLEPGGRKFKAVATSGTAYQQVAKAVLDGFPVIVWVTKRQEAETTHIDTSQGPVQLVAGEHVWVVVGYHEDGTFDVHDPYPQKNGVQTFRALSFPNWDLFERMAVFVEREGEQWLDTGQLKPTAPVIGPLLSPTIVSSSLLSPSTTDCGWRRKYAPGMAFPYAECQHPVSARYSVTHSLMCSVSARRCPSMPAVARA